MDNKKEPENHYLSMGMCLGLSIGTAIGVTLHNIPLGCSLGMCVGLCIGTLLDHLKANPGPHSQKDDHEETN